LSAAQVRLMFRRSWREERRILILILPLSRVYKDTLIQLYRSSSSISSTPIQHLNQHIYQHPSAFQLLPKQASKCRPNPSSPSSSPPWASTLLPASFPAPTPSQSQFTTVRAATTTPYQSRLLTSPPMDNASVSPLSLLETSTASVLSPQHTPCLPAATVSRTAI
jgi:hypothetical protein